MRPEAADEDDTDDGMTSEAAGNDDNYNDDYDGDDVARVAGGDDDESDEVSTDSEF